MTKVEFTINDFRDLEFIEKFNQEHWKGKSADLGWKYDVEKNDPQIEKIRNSLRRIKEKLEIIRSHFSEKDNYKNLNSKKQKITDGITVRYLSHLWIYFYKGLEKSSTNEPQLQFTIRPQNINISLWFENVSANKGYLINFIKNYSENLKLDKQISFEVYDPGLGARILNIYSNVEWDDFVEKIRSSDYNCKVGFTYFIQKEEVLKKGEDIISVIEDNLDRMRFFFESAIYTNTQILKRKELDFLDLISTKKQIILYGPPGTGKTYCTKKYALKIIGKTK